MSKVIVDNSTITDIADAIRLKVGNGKVYKMAEMPQAILSIDGGGTGEVIYTEDAILKGEVVDYYNDRITTLRDYAFAEYDNLISVDLPNVVGNKTDGDYAFYGCSYLEYVNMPELLEVRPNMFERCINLTTVNIPKVTVIQNTAFNNCDSLESIKLSSLDTGAGQAFTSCNKLKWVDFGNGRIIGNVCFRDTSLETLILRYKGVVNLQDINALENTPIEDGTGYVYVPKAFINSYKVDTKWSLFANQIRAIEDYPEICE